MNERAVQTSPSIFTHPTPSLLAIRSTTVALLPTSAAVPVRIAGGAFVAALFSLAGAGTIPSVVSFAVITALLFLFVRPVARRHLHQPAELRTGTAALIGRSGIVLERIANDEGVGVVKIDGEVWTARAYDEDDVIEAGRRVQVIQIRGATALVSE
jgi:membrane protein implicated in regulation of membrane protease activity